MPRRKSRSDSDAENFCPDDPEFFCDAPEEIGDLLSLHTSLSEMDEPPTALYRLIKAILISGGIIFVLALVLGFLAFLNPHQLLLMGLLFIGLSILVVIAVFAAVFLAASFSHYCAYVGKKGAAYFACSRSRDNIVSEQVFLFDDASDLRIATTHHYYNGSYTQTMFTYTWTDPDGKEVFSINDAHHAEHDYPPTTHVFFFAQEAEEAWSNYLLAKVLIKLKKGKTHKFPLKGSNYILLREDSLKLSLHGNTQEFDEEDLEQIEIADGQISIKEPGAKKGWFTDTGIHVFPFAELSNARVFLLLLNKLFDVPIN